MSLLDEIRHAQIIAGEDAVCKRLEKLGLIPEQQTTAPECPKCAEKDNQLMAKDEEIKQVNALLAVQTERADYAWKNVHVLEKAYQEERAKEKIK